MKGISIKKEYNMITRNTNNWFVSGDRIWICDYVFDGEQYYSVHSVSIIVLIKYAVKI